MELAVNMPAQEPQPGQAHSEISLSSSSLIFPPFTAPTPSKTVIKSTAWPLKRPASMGPPEIRMAGMLRRRAAMSMPGIILSQLATRIRPSTGWAVAMISMESAMISREGREYFMPAWFMARPSQTPMTPNSRGVPPFKRTPALAAWVILSRWMCPGMNSL